MSFAVSIENGLPSMTFQSGDDLFTNVVLSIEIEQGTFFAAPSFGLRRRRGLKRTQGSAMLIRGDVEQALQWLLDTGRATAIETGIEPEDENLNVLRITVQVTGAKGNRVSYEKFVEVV